MICDPNKLTDRGCDGAPDWIVEIISPATSSNDYVRKLNLYMDAGVKEYWIVDPLKKKKCCCMDVKKSVQQRFFYEFYIQVYGKDWIVYFYRKKGIYVVIY